MELGFRFSLLTRIEWVSVQIEVVEPNKIAVVKPNAKRMKAASRRLLPAGCSLRSWMHSQIVQSWLCLVKIKWLWDRCPNHDREDCSVSTMLCRLKQYSACFMRTSDMYNWDKGPLYQMSSFQLKEPLFSAKCMNLRLCAFPRQFWDQGADL